MEHFFKYEVRYFDKQVVIVQPPNYTAASRVSSTMHITLTYDESVNFFQWMGPCHADAVACLGICLEGCNA